MSIRSHQQRQKGVISLVPLNGGLDQPFGEAVATCISCQYNIPGRQ